MNHTQARPFTCRRLMSVCYVKQRMTHGVAVRRRPALRAGICFDCFSARYRVGTSRGFSIEPCAAAAITMRRPERVRCGRRRRLLAAHFYDGVRTVMNGIGSGGMPSMSMMTQMRSRMFSTAGGDGSGGLNKAEFTSMMQTSPTAKMGGVSGGGAEEKPSAASTPTATEI
jgi:hypothetical protein